MSLVQNRTQHILSIKTQFHRATGQSLPSHEIKLKKFILPVVCDANVQMAMQVNLTVIRTLTQQTLNNKKAVKGNNNHSHWTPSRELYYRATYTGSKTPIWAHYELAPNPVQLPEA